MPSAGSDAGRSRPDDRRLAAAVVGGAVVTGMAIARSARLARLVPPVSAVVPLTALGIATIARIAQRAARVSADVELPATNPIDLIVVIPARDEASVIADVIADVGAQDLPDAANLTVVIVDDASLDGTGEIAAAAIASAGLGERGRVVRREVPATKGAAVQAGIDTALAGRIAPGSPTTIVVLDADARVRADFLRRAASVGRLGPATARRRMMTPPAGSSSIVRWLAGVQDAEQAIDWLIQSARWTSGGASELRGDGMVIPLSQLQAVGGVPIRALCEDLELSTVLYHRGSPTRPSLELSVWEQPAITLRGLVRQRLRWAEGAIRRDVALVLPRLRDPRIPLGRRVEPAIYASQTMIGLVVVGMVAGSATRRSPRSFGTAASIVAAYGAGAVILAYAALSGGSSGMSLPRRLVGVVSAVAFGASWLVVTAAAWLRVATRRDPSSFERTEKVAGFHPPETGLTGR